MGVGEESEDIESISIYMRGDESCWRSPKSNIRHHALRLSLYSGQLYLVRNVSS